MSESVIGRAAVAAMLTIAQPRQEPGPCRGRNAIGLCRERSGVVVGFAEMAMRTRLKVLAVVAAVLAAGTSSAALARYPCAPGYTYRHGVCQPIRSPGYSNPVSGAVSGEAAGAARGAATGGPVGAIVSGALGTASGALTGTANMLAPPR